MDGPRHKFVQNYIFYPPPSKVRRGVENLTERKNLHTPVYCICLLQTLILIIMFASKNGEMSLEDVTHHLAEN